MFDFIEEQPTRPHRDRRDSGRQSWGLGIKLTNSSNITDFEHAAATMGLVTSQRQHEQADPRHSMQTSRNRTSTISDSQPATAYSFFNKLASNIGSFMNMGTDPNNNSTTQEKQQFQSKSQIEDMLESFYLSQGRQIPEWVHNPPPDPPANLEMRNAGNMSFDYNLGAVNAASSSKMAAESSKSSTSGVIGKSFSKLNIGKLSRPQFSFGLRSTSSGPSEGSGGGGGEGSRMNTATGVQPSAYDSGFDSPMGSESMRTEDTPSVAVHPAQINDSHIGGASSVPLLNTPEYKSSTAFRLDSEQPAASASASDMDDAGYFSPHSNAKSSKSPQYSRTLVDRWLRNSGNKDATKKHTGSPISLSSSMPGESDREKSSPGFKTANSKPAPAAGPFPAKKLQLGMPSMLLPLKLKKKSGRKTATTATPEQSLKNHRTIPETLDSPLNGGDVGNGEQQQHMSENIKHTNSTKSAHKPRMVMHLFKRKNSNPE
ncbi:hypothetical protein LPJ66_006926 [Kickxella alabastrina]|uniref:Uncharacterized protein n=1 Tax=Kickxella alabastrina TaxID=61397 RepID=A0ACC1IGD9_9FUNG|nr:hypothetical protein LPJ66_006926 [Kickxella alabastrina]